MDDLNAVKHETKDIINEDYFTRSLNACSTSGTCTTTLTKQRQQRNSKTSDFLRHVRLLVPSFLISRALTRVPLTEQRKVAVYSSRRMAAANSIIHLLPVSGAIVLLTLYWTKYWIGDSSDNRTMLQFVAKFHELLMQASLIDVLLSVIRTLAIHNVLPLGALSGAAQAPQLSYLWSLDFFAAISSPRFNLQHKIAFTLSVTGLLFLIASVGPSSAVLMIPRAGMPHINTSITRYLNYTNPNLFPTLLNSSSLANFPLQQRDDSQWVGSTLTPEAVVKTGRVRDDPLKKLLLVRLNNAAEVLLGLDAEILEETYIATVPTALSSLQLQSFSEVAYEGLTLEFLALVEDKVAWTQTTWQPLVLCTCTKSFERVEDVYYVRHDGSRHKLPDLSTLKQVFEAGRTVNRSDNSLRSSLWAYAPDNSHSLLAGFFRRSDVYGSIPDIVEGTSALGNLQLCTVSSFWRYTMTSLRITSLEFRVSTDIPSTIAALQHEKTTPITLDPKDMMSPNIMFYGTDDRNITKLSPAELTPDGTYFTLNLAYALASVPGRDRTDNAAGPYYPEPELVRGFDRSELNDTSLLSQVKVDAKAYGYGYGYTDTATRLALAVMVAYCTITVFHVIYSIATGHSSIAWDSATELIMLAWQARSPDHLGHVSVGMDSMNTLREQVGVRVKTVNIGDTGEVEERLELIFANDRDIERRGMRMVESNKAY